jgi:YidC/Oxa1 family membrane protein insertase
MDKKNTTIGVLLLLAAFALIYFTPRPTPPPMTPSPDGTATPAATATSPSTPSTGTAPSTASPPPALNTAFAAVNFESAEATVTTLSNDFVEARFTDSGGALREVALRKYPATLGSALPYVFNELRADPLLAFIDLPGLDRNARFQLVSKSDTEVVYRTVVDNRLEVTRRYVLAPNKSETTDPYQIRYETTFKNLTDQTTAPMPVSLSLGTSAPSNATDDGLMLKTGFSNNGDQTFIPRSDLEASSGFLGIGAHPSRPFVASGGPITWAAVKNKFFASILTGDEPARGMITRRVKLLTDLPDDAVNAYGVTGAAQFEIKGLEPRGEAKLTGTLYVGPKEYRRLANTNAFKADQDKIMDFGFFKFFSQILLTLMTWIHGWTYNWGIAIILTTLILKTIFIPFTLAASKSAKRMAKLQPELQAIREKFKDNPQKQQMATMELFKSRKINPVGGCFPILLTIPFFMGFFTMLQSAAELRFSPFLWANDLSAQDTIGYLWVIPINIMPILMGATMVIQMHLTPSPSVDNMQMKMMKIMPYIFTLFCYTFSCALSLYSFVNGLFTIGQQLVINRMKDPEEPAPAAKPAYASGKVVKNVTPKKK